MTAVPIVHELLDAPPPERALALFRSWRQPVLLHSALARPSLGRYSFLTADPVATRRIHLDELTRCRVDSAGTQTAALFGDLRESLARFQAPSVPGLPPFQGGVVGLLCYEAGRLWERLPELGPPSAPAVIWGLYDWVLAWDHAANRAWIIVQPLDDLSRRVFDRPVAGHSRPASAGGGK